MWSIRHHGDGLSLKLATERARGFAGRLGDLVTALPGGSQAERRWLARPEPGHPDLLVGDDYPESTVRPDDRIRSQLERVVKARGPELSRLSLIASRTAVVLSHANATARRGLAANELQPG